MLDQDSIDRLRLIRSGNIGPIAFRQLMARLGSAGAALAALPELASKGGGRAPQIAPLNDVMREIERTEKLGGHYLFLGIAPYPALLAETETAPPALIVRGDLTLLEKPMVAMVGARNASAAAIRFARGLALELGREGLIVVSGLARHFPSRNRIIAGLCMGTVVIEAAPKSGSLITARLANEAGREVMAVPGSPLDPRAQGCNLLIREGATLVQTAADVLEMIQPWNLEHGREHGTRLRSPTSAYNAAPPPTDADDSARKHITGLLGPVPVQVDELVRQTALPPAIVQTVLLELELAGRLARHAGGRVSI